MTPYALQSAVESRDAAALEILIDAEEEAGIDAADRWSLAQSIAHDPERLAALQADGSLDYCDAYVRIDGQAVNLYAAADLLRLRIMFGRHDEAECIARDMTDALAEAIDALIARGMVS